MASLSEIVSYTDRFLRIRDVGDWDNALNGLQIENSGRVTRIGAAVDVSTRVLTGAKKREVDLLIVHHGLFWPGLQPIRAPCAANCGWHLKTTSHFIARISLSMSIRASATSELHRARIKIRTTVPGKKGQPVGLKIRASLERSELVRKLQKAPGGPVKVFGFGPKRTRKIGVVTGAAGYEIHRVAAEGIDTSVTGESPHWVAVAAEERGEFPPRRTLRDGSVRR